MFVVDSDDLWVWVHSSLVELGHSDVLLGVSLGQLELEEEHVVDGISNVEWKAVNSLEVKFELLLVDFLFGLKSDEAPLVILGNGVVIILVIAFFVEANLILEDGNVVTWLVKSD